MLVIEGSSFVFVTVIVNSSEPDNPSSSSTTIVIVCVPTSASPGVPERVAVPSPLSVIVSQPVPVRSAVIVSTSDAI